jgi:hypothetical protein
MKLGIQQMTLFLLLASACCLVGQAFAEDNGKHGEYSEYSKSDEGMFSGKNCSPKLSVSCATQSESKLKKRKSVVETLYRGLIYPTPKTVLADPSVVSSLFEKSVIQGRVTPAGHYDDFEGAIEYFYGLALTPTSRVDAIKVRSMVASDDKVAIEVDIHFCQAPYAGCDSSIAVGGNNRTIRQTGFYTFNKSDKIISFDLTILNLGKFSDVSSAEARMQTIIGVCTALTTAHFNVITEQVVFNGTCTDQFDGSEDFPQGFPVSAGDPMKNCVAFMSSIPYGTWDQPSSNTFTCRALHSLLTPFRALHCMHVNYDGGGKCVDSDYGDFFKKEY